MAYNSNNSNNSGSAPTAATGSTQTARDFVWGVKNKNKAGKSAFFQSKAISEMEGARNTMGARELWSNRKDYIDKGPRRAATAKYNPLSIIDFWYDKQMYGKVDMEQNSIYISEAYLSPVEDAFMLPTFVHAAWRDFAEQWKKLGIFKRIEPDATVYVPGQLKLKVAWTSVHPAYHAHMAEIFSDFQSWIMLEDRRRKILTFKDFIRYMIFFISKETPMRPFTRSAFILSAKCPRSISGLQIDLAEYDDGDDKLKKQVYFGDPNFEAFAAKVAEYGFMIDFNCPWRLVANVNSPAMLEYMSTHGGVDSTDTMFKTFYYRADKTDLETFLNYMCSMWNDFVRAFPSQSFAVLARDSGTGPNSSTETSTTWRRALQFDASAASTYADPRTGMLGGESELGGWTTSTTGYSSFDLFAVNFGQGFATKLYLYMRAKEAGLDWNQKVFEREAKILTELQKNFDSDRALSYINSLTRRLPSPGGNPPYRKEYDSLQDVEKYATIESTTPAGGTLFILQV